MNASENSTIAYYDSNAEDFCASTVGVDFSATQEHFLKMLPPCAEILDFGCGSGRDTKYFLEKGHRVTAIDGSAELCRIASAYTGIAVQHKYFEELEDESKYDGIWACSSILHVKKSELADLFRRMARALKADGVIYTSFKYGDFEGVRNGRYFSNFTEASFREFIEKIPEISIEESFVSGDVRAGRGDERWLNLIIKRCLQ